MTDTVIEPQPITKPITVVKAVTYFSGGAMKAIGDNGRVGGYIITFGGPVDAQGEWFSPDVELHLDWYGGTRRPILFHHGLKDEDLIEEIGYLDTLRRDETGWWAEGQLELEKPTARRVYGDIQSEGRIGWSSGSAPHLSKVEPNGMIYEWALIEASLTPTPSAGKRTTVQALKFDTSVVSQEAEAEASTATDPAKGKEPESSEEAEGAYKSNQLTLKEKRIMTTKNMIAAYRKAGLTADQIVSILEDAAEEENAPAVQTDAEMVETPVMTADVTTDPEVAPGADAPEGTPPPTQNPETQDYEVKSNRPITAKQAAAIVEQAIQAMKTAPAPSRANGGVSIPNPTKKPNSIIAMKTKYHDLSAEDMAYLHQTRQASKKKSFEPEFYRELAVKAAKDYNADKLHLDAATVRQVAIKADYNNTLVADDGGDWVPTLWSSVLWPRVRIDNKVASNLEVFEMPSASYEYPIESTDPEVYAVAQADDAAESTVATNVFTRSKLVADKMTFNAKKLGLQVGFSTEVEEDSIIPFIPQLRGQAVRAFQNAIDNVVLNADATTGTGNINYKGANTSAAPTAKWLYGGGDGMRHLALVDNTGVQLDLQGGVPTLLALRQLRFKLLSALNDYGIDPSLLMYVVDKYTYGKMLGISEVLTYMANGRNSTVNDGTLPDIDGSPIVATAELALTDSTGYALANGTGTLGQIVLVAKPAWKIGYVRQVTTDVSYVPYLDQYILTMTARLALGRKDTTAAGLLFNIDVDAA